MGEKILPVNLVWDTAAIKPDKFNLYPTTEIEKWVG